MVPIIKTIDWLHVRGPRETSSLRPALRELKNWQWCPCHALQLMVAEPAWLEQIARGW